MQHELLLEIFSEEIPAKLQRKALENAKSTFANILTRYGTIFGDVSSFVSPRRLTVVVNHLSSKTEDMMEEKRGPKITAPQTAIDGFLRSNQKTREDLIERDGYYYLKIHTKGIETKTLIGDIIENFILEMPWPKSMRWYLEDQEILSAFWVRPIRSILCIYNGSSLNEHIKSVDLTTCSYTYGHRFLSTGKLEITDFADYRNQLESNYIMLDFERKKSYIDNEINSMAGAMGLYFTYDEELLDEVSGLVEYPFASIGAIDEKFMKLPQEVLSTSMKTHQKYFTLVYPGSVMAPYYGTITNIPPTKIMCEGLDRVLRARLSDAMFFYNEDLDVTLEAFAQRLSNVVFYDKLGTVAQKVDRMMSIASTREEHRAIALSKADLLTQMVGEFPELQGVIGEIYARCQSESNEVCIAIREHYKPINANDDLPQTVTGARVSFFDKLDTLVGLLGIGVQPTGSKDPFALRRAALSVARLLCDFPKTLLDNESLSWYVETLITAYSDQGIALDQDTLQIVLEFIVDRLKMYMCERLSLDTEVVESVIRSFDSLDFDYKIAMSKARRLQKLTKLEEFQIVKEAYKRTVGIIGENVNELKTGSIDDLRFDDQYMVELQNTIKNQESDQEDFSKIVTTAKAVLSACDNVLINNPSQDIRLRNLKLLNKFLIDARNIIGA
ncbi:MAG: glycine--tRNA ligase subunit beta [Holosporales bacterium]|jgi:glycyl-tRNA synthetase beta chain|nr:glycine--tRNA ligase subunit beta [Holosporales bacterium]